MHVAELVWRELRRIGALSLGQGAWAVPDVPGFADGIQRATELAHRGEGEVVTLSATGHTEQDTTRMRELFTADRQKEWSEFLADCAKFDAPRAPEADQQLKHCVQRLEQYTEQVFQALHQM